MLRRLIEFALTQRLFTVLAALIIAALGVWAFLNIPIDAFPDITQTQVKIILKAPGMTPEEVEARVIAPIEMELLGIPNQAILRSTAKYAVADITIDFTDGTDIYWARQQVAERFSSVRPDLPATVSGGLAPISTPLSDVFMFTIEGGSLTLDERRSLLDWTIRPVLRTIPGVADVNSLGGMVRAFEVEPNAASLAAAGLSISDLSNAIQSANRNDGAGRLNEGEKALLVRTQGAIRSTTDIEQIVLKTDNGRVLRVSDVAAVRLGSLTRYGGVTKDGNGEAVEGIVLSLRGADARAIIESVREHLESIKPTLPAGVQLKVFYDRSDLVDRAVETVKHALIEAVVLVVILLLAFLGSLRAAIVVAVTLPTVALTTFLVMRVFGMSANLMSLGGLAIAIGLIVDAAVVVVENTVERLSRGTAAANLPLLHQIYLGASEVGSPVAAGIIIICLVFLPLLSLQGLEGKMFAPVALTIVIALAASLVVSITLIPVISSFLLRPSHHRSPPLMRLSAWLYKGALGTSLAHPIPVYFVCVGAISLALFSYESIGKTFMPEMDEGSVVMQTIKLPSINLKRGIETDLIIQRALMKAVPEIEHIISRVGSDEIGLDPMGPNETDVFIVLRPKSQWRVPDKEWLVQKMRDAISDLPGADYSFTQPIEMRVSEMLTGARGDLAVKIFGPDLGTLGNLAARIKVALSRVPGAKEVLTLSDDSVDYLQIEMNRLMAGRTNLSVTGVEDELRARLEGTEVGIVTEPGRRTPIIVRGPQLTRDSPELFAQSELVAGDGGLVHLADIANLQRQAGTVKVERENASRFATVQAFVSGRDLVGFVEEAQKVVAEQIKLPEGYRLVWGGEFENQRRAAARLSMVIPIAIALIFVVLFGTLGSMRQALLILANVPFAMVGGILALSAAREYLSVPASVGFIALLGIAVLNGLVLVSHFNHLLSAGVPISTAVYEGAQRRLRPVMMTATITACGLLPLMVASGPGSEIQKPLAIVVVGGLVTSTALTLILLPILFQRFGVATRATVDNGKELRWKNPFAN